MPSSLISSIAAVASGSRVFSAFNELTGMACWQAMYIKDVEVNSSSLNTSHPISTEQSTESSTYTSLISSDIESIKIIQPSSMRITAFCADISSVENVVSIFKDTQATMTITTKGITANGLVIVAIEIEHTPDMMSAMKLSIELEQAIPPSSIGDFNPAQSSDSNTYGVSVQTLPSAATSATTLYNKVLSFIGI